MEHVLLISAAIGHEVITGGVQAGAQTGGCVQARVDASARAREHTPHTPRIHHVVARVWAARERHICDTLRWADRCFRHRSAPQEPLQGGARALMHLVCGEFGGHLDLTAEDSSAVAVVGDRSAHAPRSIAAQTLALTRNLCSWNGRSAPRAVALQRHPCGLCLAGGLLQPGVAPRAWLGPRPGGSFARV